MGDASQILEFHETKTYRFVEEEYLLQQGSLSGTVYQELNVIFVFQGKQGQHLSTSVTGTTENNDVVLWIEGPERIEFMEAEADVTTEWSGVLPATGEYLIHVGLIESDVSRYHLKISLQK